MFKAAQNGEVQVVELLLKYNANINHIDNSGWTALNLACAHGKQDVVEILLKNGLFLIR